MVLVGVWCCCFDSAAPLPAADPVSSAPRACCHRVDAAPTTTAQHPTAPTPCKRCVVVELRQKMLNHRGRSAVAPLVGSAFNFAPAVIEPSPLAIVPHLSARPID